MDVLERDASEVPILIRSVKNSFAPINQIPPEVLSLIPDHWDYDGTDQDLITLTHVCRTWRTIFTSRPSLWSYLECRDVDKTRVYIERSKVSPLEVYIEDSPDDPYIKYAVLLMTQLINRLKCLTISAEGVSHLFDHFACRAPLLKTLAITFSDLPPPALSNTFLDGDFSSLDELRLDGIITHLAWKSLSNLTTFELSRIPASSVSVTQLLNLFGSAPLLRVITLEDSLPASSDAPPARILSLTYLKELKIDAHQPHLILLNNLSIPTGASLVLEFDFDGNASLLLDYASSWGNSSFTSRERVSCLSRAC